MKVARRAVKQGSEAAEEFLEDTTRRLSGTRCRQLRLRLRLALLWEQFSAGRSDAGSSRRGNRLQSSR